MRFLATILLSMCFLFSCKTKEFTPATYEKEQIKFGNGGGFTGAYNSYYLLSNGQLFLREGRKGKYRELPAIKKKEAQILIEKIQNLQLAEQKLDAPGNLYKFLELSDSTQLNKATWGRADTPVTPEIENLYLELMELIKAHHPTDENNNPSM